MSSFSERYSGYFLRPVAEKAAKSLTNGAEIEFQIVESIPASPAKAGDASGKPANETFTLAREDGRNRVKTGAGQAPQLLFQLTPQAAEAILQDASEEIGEIAVHIARMIVAGEGERRISIRFKAGFLSLYSKGYLGVLGAGGSSFASFLASRGLSGMGAVKAALKKARGD